MTDNEWFSSRDQHDGPAKPLMYENTITDIFDDRTYDDAEEIKW